MQLANFESEVMYSSRYLVEQINIFRKQEGNEVELLHKNLLAKIEIEFEDEIGELKIQPTSYTDASNRQSKMYELNFEYSLQILMSESKSVRKRCVEVMKQQQKQISKPKEYTIKELLTLQLESIERAEKAEQTVAILTHVNKTYTSTEISKELRFKSANELNKKLHDLGIQYKQNETWVLYSKYSNLAYVDIKQEVLDSGRVVYHRRWTQIGRDFLIKLLNN